MSISPAFTSISILVPVYNEEENIKEFYYQTDVVLSSLKIPYEIIFVDDGSKDKTYKIISDIQAQDKRVKIIKLSKNYGQLYALLTGFEFAKGEVIITMDADLQNDPNDIPKFLDKIEAGFDFVNGWRFERKDSLSRKLISKIANWLAGSITGIALHDYGCGFVATKKGLVNKLISYDRNARFIKPLLVRLADSVLEIKVNHYPRKSGKSKYNLLKIIKSGLDLLFNFTPIRFRMK